jgi:AcrR family transcriptional regulator
MPPQRRHRVDTDGWPTRELILLEASRLFATRGYLGTSTRDIATAVGIQQPSRYSHFASKHAIAEELLRRDLTAGIAALERFTGEGGGPAVALYRYLRWEVRHDLESPFDLRSLYLGALLDQPEFAE